MERNNSWMATFVFAPQQEQTSLPFVVLGWQRGCLFPLSDSVEGPGGVFGLFGTSRSSTLLSSLRREAQPHCSPRHPPPLPAPLWQVEVIFFSLTGLFPTTLMPLVH